MIFCLTFMSRSPQNVNMIWFMFRSRNSQRTCQFCCARISKVSSAMVAKGVSRPGSLGRKQIKKTSRNNVVGIKLKSPHVWRILFCVWSVCFWNTTVIPWYCDGYKSKMIRVHPWMALVAQDWSISAYQLLLKKQVMWVKERHKPSIWNWFIINYHLFMVIWGMVYGIALPTLEQSYLEIRGHLHQCQKHVKWLPAVPSEARHKWYSPVFP